MPEPDAEILGDVPDREPIEYRKDGGINAWVDDRRVRLRPPRLREFRKLLQAWRDSLQEMDDLSQEGRDWMDEMARRMTDRDRVADPGSDADPEGAGDAPASAAVRKIAEAQAVALGMTAEERKHDRELQWKMDDAWEDCSSRWWAAAIDTLAPEGFSFDADALPITLSQMQTVSATITHWRTVPSRSGGQ